MSKKARQELVITLPPFKTKWARQRWIMGQSEELRRLLTRQARVAAGRASKRAQAKAKGTEGIGAG